MRTLKTLVIVALFLSMGSAAFAELQNVEVGGKLVIRGNYWRNGVDIPVAARPAPKNFSEWWTQEWNVEVRNQIPHDYKYTTNSFAEQRTLLNVKADFTNDVSAFIELDSYGIWGENFRSDYITGIDKRGGSDVSLYQAYVNVKNLWGTPLSLRVGRQELVFGSEFLLGNNSTMPLGAGLSFDAIRLTFANDMFKADAFAAKLNETFKNFGKGDVDLYGVYGSYIGIENVAIDAYWLYIQDNTVVGNDVDLHTFGLRGAGTLSGFDFEAEVAYQIGEVDHGREAKGWFAPKLTDVDYDNFAANAELGYTLDIAWQLRPFAKFAYFGGNDFDKNQRKCPVGPWYAGGADVQTQPFNRLFSDVSYSVFLDNLRNLSNLTVYSLGLQATPTECVTLKLMGTFLDMEKADRVNVPRLFRNNRTVVSKNSYGWEVGGSATYHYSEDLAFSAGYSHMFASDDEKQFANKHAEGFFFRGIAPHPHHYGNDRNDYFYLQTEISF